MILKLYFNNDAYPLDGVSNWFVTHSYGGNKLMQFDISVNHSHYKKIFEEAVIEYDSTLYLVKQINERTASGTATVNCEIDLDGLKSKIYPEYNIETDTFDHIAYEILDGTGWEIINPELVTNRRSMELTDVTPLDILEHCTNSTMYGIVYDFDNINRKIRIVKPTLKETSDVYFTDELNLTNVSYKASSTSLITRLYAYGKDDLTIKSVNDDKEYVDNTDYCDKVVCAVWRDERYTNAQSLKDAAIEKLRVLSQPERSYTCKIVDLAKISSEYNFLDISLYEMVTLIDREHRTKTLNQIVEYKEYPNTPERNEATLSTVSAKITTKLTTINKMVNEINTDNIVNKQKINVIARDAEANSARIAEIYTEGDSNCILNSLINQTATEIRTEVSQKIGKDELSTQLVQNSEYIQMAWNKVSEVIQFIDATLSIFDSAGADKNLLLKLCSTGLCVYSKEGTLLMELNRKGENFYHNGAYLGKIGTNNWAGYENVRGLVIDLEYSNDYASYIALAAKDSANANTYNAFLTYFNKDAYIGSSRKKGLHLGTNFYANGYPLYFSNRCYLKNYDYQGGICIESGSFIISSEGEDSDDTIIEFSPNDINVRHPLYMNGNYLYFSDRCCTKDYGSQGGICIQSGSLVITSEGSESDDIIIEVSPSNIDFYYDLDMHDNSIYNAVIESDSDERLKRNIQDTAINGLDIINSLKLRQFDWKADNTHCDIGFIAQEVEQVNPNFMGTKSDGYHTVKQVDMIPFLVKSVQELSKTVCEQQKVIEKMSEIIGLNCNNEKPTQNPYTIKSEKKQLVRKTIKPIAPRKNERK